MKKLCFSVLAILFFTSCTQKYSSNGENLYIRARNGDPLQILSPLTRANISNYYDLPAQNQDPKVSIAPPVTS